jgi:hypothetical protein
MRSLRISKERNGEYANHETLSTDIVTHLAPIRSSQFSWNLENLIDVSVLVATIGCPNRGMINRDPRHPLILRFLPIDKKPVLPHFLLRP